MGIYDMVGGISENIIGNMKDISGNFQIGLSRFISAPLSKCYDSYAYSDSPLSHERGLLGDALEKL